MIQIILLLLARPAERVPARPPVDVPAYFANESGVAVQPLTGPVDTHSRVFLEIPAPGGPLIIQYRNILSVEDPSTGKSAFRRQRKDFLRIEFTEAGEAHVLVLKLDEHSRGTVLKRIRESTGIVPR